MKKLMVLFLLILIPGCALFQPDDQTVIQPRLLKQAPLPYIPETIYSENFTFFCEMIVDEMGNVESAKLLTHSGDENWDSLAAISLLDWKFEPAELNGIPVKIMIRRRVEVKFESPEIIPLAEIVFNNFEQADSVYNLLLAGADFNKMVFIYSVSSSKKKNGMLGDVEIKHYIKSIANALSDLKENEFTRPLVYGDNFVIFKRLKHNN